MMETQARSNPHTLRTRIWFFAQGVSCGVVFYIVLAFLAILLERHLLQAAELCRTEAIQLDPLVFTEPCIPDWIFALLNSISWGPGTLLWFLFWPIWTERLVQITSGLIFGGVAGISFLIKGRKLGFVIYLAFFIVNVALWGGLGYLMGS